MSTPRPLSALALPAPSGHGIRLSGGARLNVVVFWTVQASALLVFTVAFHWSLAALGVASHFIRMLGITLGFHNHHRFPRAARNGIYWWEIDPTWWTIRARGLAWDIQPVPAQAYDPRRTEYAA